ncbi:hypothetical protein RD792_009335 [Penstemon davidsonii]|uniref:Small rubber particle protein n=1 Tax=Penstemon davidsonii TaxID=160366 RepID=A0ABR0CYR7_9LAMI|nr:hypothetical protein RD792_009335 [Penstemon davidsonii]
MSIFLKIQENDEKKLKYLDFVQVVAIYVVIWCSTLYEYAKENSGPLRSGVQTVEGTVKTVTRPVYEKLHDIPFELLKFFDHKVDKSITELDAHVPILLKKIARQTWVAAQTAPEVARELASEVHQRGLINMGLNLAKSTYHKYEPAARELYVKYEPLAEQYAVTAWLTLNRLPLFPQVAHIMVPTAAYWAEKYNQVVAYSADRGYTVSYYLPLLPIEKIAKIFDGAENGLQANLVNGEYLAISQ